MRIFAALFLLLLSFSIWGQPDEKWNQGVVVLSDGKVLTGSIQHTAWHNLIVIQTSNGRSVLVPSRVSLLRYYDDCVNLNRQFVSLETAGRGFSFYEVVISGKVTVLRSLKRFARSSPDEIESYTYYSWMDNKLESLDHFCKRIYPKLVQDLPEELHSYCARKHLHLHETKSAFLIIEEYNRIMQKDVLAMTN